MVNILEEFLRKVTIFQELEDDDLRKLSEFANEVEIGAGEMLFREGDQGDRAYIIKEGAVEIKKEADGEQVLLAIVGSGEVIGEMALLDEAPRMASAIAQSKSKLLSISSGQLDELMNTSASATRALLFTITSRWRETEALLLQNEKMAQLGTLTAGMAHEMNNPAAAIQRGSVQINEAFEQYLEIQKEFFRTSRGAELLAALKPLEQKVLESITNPPKIDSLARSDIEYAIEDWLESEELEDAWELAPALANLGLHKQALIETLADIPQNQIPNVLRWMSTTFNMRALIEETGQAAEHISKVVLALKTYAYQKSSPAQEFDLHQNIEDALLLTESLMQDRIAVHKEFGNGVPNIVGYPNELGQVWTNLIQNSIDAIEGKGEITIETRLEDGYVEIDFTDTGSGIPVEIQDKVFDPFFTTKPPGQGAGLGLTISYNIINQKHHGKISIVSRAGKTTATVKLPISDSDKTSTPPAVSEIGGAGDDTIRDILSNTKDIAVVGASTRRDRAGNSVPLYLQMQGYNTIPVNPHIDEAFGKKSYSDVLSIPGNVDLVQIFRRSDEVPAIVDQAIAKHAKVVWMQEGVIHQEAAQKARDAGLMVVMDACMRKQHLRLMGSL